ncbi:hypothetical protein [Clostridium culturomicium]|uniref:hypothetical protein n=1 Tax=Clostridium culturomicium TaxID=1499683 RepID=UPI0038573B16
MEQIEDDTFMKKMYLSLGEDRFKRFMDISLSRCPHKGENEFTCRNDEEYGCVNCYCDYLKDIKVNNQVVKKKKGKKINDNQISFI